MVMALTEIIIFDKNMFSIKRRLRGKYNRKIRQSPFQRNLIAISWQKVQSSNEEKTGCYTAKKGSKTVMNKRAPILSERPYNKTPFSSMISWCIWAMNAYHRNWMMSHCSGLYYRYGVVDTNTLTNTFTHTHTLSGTLTKSSPKT